MKIRPMDQSRSTRTRLAVISCDSVQKMPNKAQLHTPTEILTDPTDERATA
jgi:nitrous oxide reductase